MVDNHTQILLFEDMLDFLSTQSVPMSVHYVLKLPQGDDMTLILVEFQ